jgi:hypothetical protein
MNLDATTFALEILNFAVLLWLLRRFLFKPVQAALAARAQAEQQQRDTLDARQQALDARAQALATQEAAQAAQREAPARPWRRRSPRCAASAWRRWTPSCAPSARRPRPGCSARPAPARSRPTASCRPAPPASWATT